MRLLLARFAMVLLALSVAAPALMALEECATECAADDADCGSADCCSCCPIARSAGIEANAAVQLPGPGARCLPSVAMHAADGPPRGILHVPRLLAS